MQAAAAVEAREVSHATRSNCPLGVAAIARQAARQRWHKVLHCAAESDGPSGRQKLITATVKLMPSRHVHLYDVSFNVMF